MDPFLRKAARTIDRYSLIGEGERVLVALSGGADSVALLEVLRRLAPGRGWTLAAAHLHHGLRGGEADRDESFARSLAERLGISLACRRLEPGTLRGGGRSLEEAAREARYTFLREAAASFGASRIALGHHRGDQAETVLMNLLRGSGIEGLKGMRPLRDGLFIRPLLQVSRQEILDFLGREGISFREDETNRDERFFRNRVRNDLLPLLCARYNRRIEVGLAQLAQIALREDDFLEGAVREAMARLGLDRESPRPELELARLLDLHEAVRYRIVKMLLGRLAPGWRVGHGHVESVLALAAGRRPQGTVHLPGGVRALREYGRLRLDTGAREDTPYAYAVTVPGRVEVPRADCRLLFSLVKPPAGRGSRTTVLFDADRIAWPLALRSPRPGDRIRPLGLGGAKKLQDVFTDGRVPRSRRPVTPVLEDREGILWVAGVCRSERARVEAETTRILRVEMSGAEPPGGPSQSV
jgi:tRNA(Ile)-lysidine synthase